MKQATFAKWLLIITCTHLLLGAIIFYSPLQLIVQQGWWNTVGPDNLETAIAFWFMLFGFPMLMLVCAMWGNNALVTQRFLYFSLIGSIIVGLAIPFSGIWTLTLLSGAALVMLNGKNLVSAELTST